MGKTADTMTQRQALKMRMAINVLIELTDPDRYAAAIEQRLPATSESDADYEIHLYVRDPRKAGIVDLACLARAIENLGIGYNTVDSTYDAGTEKGKKNLNSVKIW